MRVMVTLATVLVLLASAGCKKDKGSAVDKAVEAATQVATTAAQAGSPTCPACPEAPACPTCAVCAECPDPAALAKADLGAEASTLKVLAPAGFNFTVEKAGEYQIDAMATDKDPILRLFKGDEFLTSDDDSGGDKNARLFAFLEPGAYTARVSEVNWAAMEAKVKVAEAPAITSAGALTLGGDPLEATTTAGPNNRESCAEFSLEIATAGKYQINAAIEGDFDAYLVLISNNAVVETNDDFESDSHNSRLERDLEPGTYTVRVYDYQNRAATIKVSAAAL